MSSHPSSSFPELRWVPVAQSLLLRLNLSSAGWQDSTRQRNGRKARKDQVVLRLHRKVGRGSHATPCLGCRGCGREWRPRKPWWEEGTTHTVADICIVQGIMILSISRGGIAPQLGSNQIKVAEIDARHDLSRWFQPASMLMLTTS